MLVYSVPLHGHCFVSVFETREALIDAVCGSAHVPLLSNGSPPTSPPPGPVPPSPPLPTMPRDSTRLMFRGVRVEGSKSLKEFGIENGSELIAFFENS